MRDGTCTKCKNPTVHMGRNALRLGERTHAVLQPHTEPGFRGMIVGHNTEGIWQFVCGTCGYLEMHVLDAAALAFIRGAWPKVPVQAPQPR